MQFYTIEYAINTVYNQHQSTSTKTGYALYSWMESDWNDPARNWVSPSEPAKLQFPVAFHYFVYWDVTIVARVRTCFLVFQHGENSPQPMVKHPCSANVCCFFPTVLAVLPVKSQFWWSHKPVSCRLTGCFNHQPVTLQKHQVAAEDVIRDGVAKSLRAPWLGDSGGDMNGTLW